MCSNRINSSQSFDPNESQMSHFGNTPTGLSISNNMQNGVPMQFPTSQNPGFGTFYNGQPGQQQPQLQDQAGAASNAPRFNPPPGKLRPPVMPFNGHPSVNAAITTENRTGLQTAITPESLNSLMDKPITELTVADIIQINMISNDPIRQQISTMEKDFGKKFQSMEDRINILDKEKSKLEEENTVLRNVVTNMQRSLNRIDSDIRNKNVIITGLPEGVIQFGDNGETYTTDKGKIKWLLQRMENNDFDNQIEGLDVSRIGEEKAGSNRVVKIVMESVEKRDKFLKNTSKMKDAPEPWNKVFVKKDQHPVYIAENNRLRKKAYDLKRTQGYENKEVKVFNGKVLVDNVVVDKNLFFQ